MAQNHSKAPALITRICYSYKSEQRGYFPTPNFDIQMMEWDVCFCLWISLIPEFFTQKAPARARGKILPIHIPD